MVFDKHRLVGVEWTRALTADPHRAIGLVVRPGDLFFGSHAGIEHPGRGLRRVLGAERLPPRLQRVRFTDMASKDFTALGKATGIEHPSQGRPGAVGAFFLGLTEGRSCISAGSTFEIGGGSIMKRDEFIELKQFTLTVIDKRFERRLMGLEAIGNTIERWQGGWQHHAQ